MASTKRPPVDWEAVEREYRAGLRSLASIGEEFGVSAPGILKKAKKDGWERDLSAKIKAKAEAKVNAATVNGSVNGLTAVNEREVVEANAEMMASVIRGHHKILSRMRGIAMQLMDRLEAELEGTELFRELGDMMKSIDEATADRLGDLYRKVTSLPVQTDTAKKLAEMLKTIVELERRVFKIDDLPPDLGEKVTRIELVALQ